jgi:hypothetical protein
LNAFVIDDVREIAAPPAIVWDVITDLSAYPQWNPFVIACRSTLLVGEPIAMRVRLLPWFTQPQTETVLEHVPGERLCYGLAGGTLGAVASRRSHELSTLGTGRTRYRSHFELSGWLAGFVRALLGRRLERGFRTMTDAIQERAEKRTTETR